MKYPDFLMTYQSRIEHVLDHHLPSIEEEPHQLHEAMRYAVLNGGKRLRPALLYATGAMLGTDLTTLDNPAAAVEFIHCYSLVHDDLPAMDDDHLRRGKPTCHIAFDEGTAILVGDALQLLAFQCLAESHSPQLNQQQCLNMLTLLAKACGSLGMAGGQALDIQNIEIIDLSMLEKIHHLKTGTLFSACVKLGVIAANCYDSNILNCLDKYTHFIGLAFQIRDDILDVISSTETLGKQQGADKKQKKMSYASLMDIEQAKKKLDECHREAIQALTPLGKKAETLIAISDFIVTREQ